MKADEILSLPQALPEGANYDAYIIGTYNVAYPAIITMPKLAPMLRGRCLAAKFSVKLSMLL